MTHMIAGIVAILMAMSNGSAYIMKAEAVPVENDVIVIESYDGNPWAVYANGYTCGENVIMVMGTNETPDNVLDDECLFLEKRVDKQELLWYNTYIKGQEE